jgi:hypothetical protein
MLFARLRSDDRAFWFLGPASYVNHESNLPMAMAVTWRQHPLPGDLVAQFAAAVACRRLECASEFSNFSRQPLRRFDTLAAVSKMSAKLQ